MSKKMVIWALVMGCFVATSGLAMAGAGAPDEKAAVTTPAKPTTEAAKPAVAAPATKPAEAAAPAAQAAPAKPAKKKIEGC